MRKRVLSLVLICMLVLSLIPTPVSAAPNKVYEVNKGDNLYRIGKNYDVNWRDIAKLNKIKEPYTIQIGQELQIPLTKDEKEVAKNQEKLKLEALNKEKEEIETEDYMDSDYDDNLYDDYLYDEDYDNADNENTPVTGEDMGVSNWALEDLLLGGYYDIYPNAQYENLAIPITSEELNNLIKKLDKKIRIADGVLSSQYYILDLKDNMTVDEVLNSFFTLFLSYEYSKDIGLNKNDTPSDYMQKHKIFRGNQGELSLNDVCTIEQAYVFASRIVTFIYNELDAASKGFLWEVKNDGNTAYLLGSIHIANYDIYPLSDTMMNAYNKSDELIVEVNMFDILGLMEFMQIGCYSDNATLKDHVSLDTYENAIQLGERLLGLTEEDISTFKPWYLTNLFSSYTSAGSLNSEDVSMATTLGIDIAFMTKSMLYAKPIAEIEGYVEQGKLFDELSEGLQETLLIESINSLQNLMTNQSIKSTESAYIDSWLKYWNNGDIEGFKNSFNIEDELIGNNIDSIEMKKYYDEYYNALITKRDKKMANYIDNLLKSKDNKTYFIVVGALHYTSEYSVIDMLKEKGYEINQMK